MSGYRVLWRDPRVRSLFVAAFFARIPALAAPLVFTLHVVQNLDGTYAQAGLVAAASTIGAGIGSPWRGRLIDRLGLRRAVIPSVVAVAVLYPLAAFASFVFLVPLAFCMGLFLIPIFSIMRQALSVLVSVDRRRLAFSADSVVAEASFIIGPATGVLVVTQFGASAALVAIGLSEAAAGAMLLRLDPPLRSVAETPDAQRGEELAATKEPWMSAQIGFLFLISGGAVITLIATDLGIVAVLETLDNTGAIALVFALWGGASLVGGVLYGAWHRSYRPTHLLLALGLTTIPVGLAGNVWALALAVIPTGFLCAPTLTAAAEWITELTPEDRRGEAIGWHGTSFTIGAAIGAPAIGLSIDQVGPWGSFALGGLIATVIALIAWGAQLLPGLGPPPKADTSVAPSQLHD
ncbi:MFS transporter [Aeromicrobium sp. CF3.5]|uniref:MFS transporter n=1 Tax=Aeromicrobium sp. CF3.5 TaxID=3373078 RepID=UPI003EE6869A